MAVEKLSVSLQPDLAQQTRKAADASGRTVSAFVALAVEHQLKLETSRRLLEEWETQHGAITEQERQRVRSRWPA